MIFSIAFGYFYNINQAQQQLQSEERQNSNFLSLKNQESLYITTNLIGGNLTFSVNNTGIATDLVAYFISNQNGNVLKEKTGSSANPPACTTPAILPCELNAGASTTFTPYTSYSTGTDTIRVLTGRGTTVVGTYPTQELTSSSLESYVASGLGSLQMIFSSFTFYNYSSTDPWQLNLSSAEPAAITPFSKNIAFSAQITNNDPSGGTIVLNAHSDLWTFLSCGSGCGTQSLLAFYIMNVGSDGIVTSATSGSFVPVEIPYGTTATVYFGSSCDLSLSSCSSYSGQSISDNVGEHDVFMIFSGTLVTSTEATLYSQNLPFAASFTSDNIATYSSTPTTCGNGSSSSFTLSVSNTNWTPTADGIDQVQVQASSFSGITVNPVDNPTGWTDSISGSTITWTATLGSSYYIKSGETLTFKWSGTAPTVSAPTEETFPSTVTFYKSSYNIYSQPITTGCYVG